MEERHLEHLSYYFKHIDEVESLDKLCDEENSFPWMNVTYTLPTLALNEYKFGQVIDYSKNVSLI